MALLTWNGECGISDVGAVCEYENRPKRFKNTELNAEILTGKDNETDQLPYSNGETIKAENDQIQTCTVDTGLPREEPVDSASAAGSCTTDENEDAISAKTRPPLQRFRPGYLWVSDLTRQSWCEQQLYYSFTVPALVEETPIMTEGTNLHLERGSYSFVFLW